MSGRKEDIEVSWFLQESLKEKTIYDAAGVNDNVKIAGDGTIAVASKTKVHIFSPHGKHQQFFSTEWLVLESRDGESEENSINITPLQWLRKNLSTNPNSIKDIQWLEIPIDSLIFWNLCVLLSDGDMIILRSSSTSTSPVDFQQQQLFSKESSNISCSNQANGILWQYKKSTFSDMYGLISCISMGNTHNQKRAPTFFTVHTDQIVCWDPNDLKVSPLFQIPSGLLQISIVSIVKMSSYWMDEKEDSCLSLLCCRQQSDAHLVRISNVSFDHDQKNHNLNSSTITIDHRKIVPFEGYFQCLYSDNLTGRFILVTSHSLFSGSLRNEDFNIHIHEHNQSVDIMGISFLDFHASNLEKAASSHDSVLACHRSGEIHCLHLTSSFVSNQVNEQVLHDPLCISKWSSRRGGFGSSGLAIDNISSLIFITYNVPAILNSSRDVQLKTDLGRPMLLMRPISSHLFDLPRFGIFTWDHRTHYIYSLVMRGNRYPNDSKILLLLRLMLLMQDWNETLHFLGENDVALPPHMNEVLNIMQQTKELLNNQGEPINDFVMNLELLNEQRDIYYSTKGEGNYNDDNYEEGDEEDDANVEESVIAADDSDSDLSASNDRTPTSKKASNSRKKNSSSTKKPVSKNNQKKPSGFTLKYLYQDLKTFLPPNPFALVHILLHKWVYSLELLAMISTDGDADQWIDLTKDVFIEKLKENEDISRFMQTMNETNSAGKLNFIPSQLLSLHNIHGYSGIDSIASAAVLKSLQFRLALLSQMHMNIAGLASSLGIPIQMDFLSYSENNLENHLQREYTYLLAWVKIRILQIRCILFLHRLRRQTQLSNGPFSMNLNYMSHILSLTPSLTYTASSYFSSVAASETVSQAPILRDSLLFLSDAMTRLSNRSTVPPLSLGESCDICAGSLSISTSQNPRESLSAYCRECDLHFDRCCFSLQLLTSTKNSSGSHSYDMTQSPDTNIFYCTLCETATRENTLRELMSFYRNTSLSDDADGVNLEDMDTAVVRNVFCPYCQVKMKPL